MPLKQLPVRFDPEMYELVHYAAAIETVSASKFCADASISRGLFVLYRHNPKLADAWDKAYEAVADIHDIIDQARADQGLPPRD